MESLADVAGIVKRPEASAMVDLFVPLMVIVAAGTGLPSSLMTVPLIVMDWHMLSKGHSVARSQMVGFIFFVFKRLPPELRSFTFVNLQRRERMIILN